MQFEGTVGNLVTRKEEVENPENSGKLITRKEEVENEKNTVVARTAAKDTKDLESWKTVPGRTRKVRIQGEPSKPMIRGRKKPMENKPVVNERSSHSFV